jgi:hypothetical protein
MVDTLEEVDKRIDGIKKLEDLKAELKLLWRIVYFAYIEQNKKGKI